METFERMGIAILREIARNDLKLVQHFRRFSLDALCKQYDNLVAAGDPNESLLRFRVLRQSFFDFPALDVREVFEDQATAIVSYGMGSVGEEAATYQTLGFFERCWNAPAERRSRFRCWPVPGPAIRRRGFRWRGRFHVAVVERVHRFIRLGHLRRA